jgi:hypothetical protein
MIRLLALARRRGFLDPLDLTSRRRVERCVEHPTPKAWDESYSVIVGSDGYTTLWQAVLLTDPSFPAPNLTGKTKWPRIPSQDLLIRAIALVTNGNNLKILGARS